MDNKRLARELVKLAKDIQSAGGYYYDISTGIDLDIARLTDIMKMVNKGFDMISRSSFNLERGGNPLSDETPPSRKEIENGIKGAKFILREIDNLNKTVSSLRDSTDIYLDSMMDKLQEAE